MQICQFAKGKPCDQPADPDSKYCGRHKRGMSHELKTYLLDKVEWRERLSQLAGNDYIKTLTEEISLARMVLEKLMNSVRDAGELVGHIPKITNLLQTIERLQKSNDEIEKKVNQLITKPALIRIAGEIGQILVEELKGIDNYEDTVDHIIERVLDTMSNASNKEDELT